MWRIVSGTARDVTTEEVTTGSVAQRTAPSRKASAQARSPNRSFAPTASRTSVIGIAITSARAGGPQWRASSSRSTSSPSETRVRIRASSISSTMPSSPTSTETTSSSASTIPSAIESTEAESTVPRIRPESAAVTASSAPKISAASPKERSISARTSRRSPRSCGSARPTARRRCAPRWATECAPSSRPASGGSATVTSTCVGPPSLVIVPAGQYGRGAAVVEVAREGLRRSRPPSTVTGRVASYWSERSQLPAGRSSSAVADSPLSTVVCDQASASAETGRCGEARHAGRLGAGGQPPIRPGAASVSPGWRPAGLAPRRQSV